MRPIIRWLGYNSERTLQKYAPHLLLCWCRVFLAGILRQNVFKCDITLRWCFLGRERGLTARLQPKDCRKLVMQKYFEDRHSYNNSLSWYCWNLCWFFKNLLHRIQYLKSDAWSFSFFELLSSVFLLQYKSFIRNRHLVIILTDNKNSWFCYNFALLVFL